MRRAEHRTAIVGGGVAGTLLAWRLRELRPDAEVHLYTGTAGGRGADASGTSGGLVRGFEADPDACQLAAESMAELGRDAVLREWAGYREVGSLYLLGPGAAAPDASLRKIEALLPGSASLLPAARLTSRYPLRGLPAGSTGVVERQAGYLSPARLRDCVLADLAVRGTAIRRADVAGVTPDPAVLLADGTRPRYDVVVVAAGAWTPRLLAGSGLDSQGLRTKQIQYSLVTARLPGLGAFLDGVSGLYGRPAGDDRFLLGLPVDRWDVDPDTVQPDLAGAEEVLAHAGRTFGAPVTPLRPPRVVTAFDCYSRPPVLALRRVAPDSALFTFTGGSGGAAKSVLAASRAAAHSLTGLPGNVESRGRESRVST
jgi:glycine/D-amino acid oxidase-like deaminating enzyme